MIESHFLNNRKAGAVDLSFCHLRVLKGPGLGEIAKMPLTIPCSTPTEQKCVKVPRETRTTRAVLLVNTMHF